MLSVAQDAPADEIKKAFRREIARYHPDKVQHLGQEFQEMAAGIAADLTEAYRILMDPTLRTKYDQDLRDGGPPRPSVAPPPAPPQPQAPPKPQASAPSSAHQEPASARRAATEPEPRSAAGLDFVKRVTMSKLREAIGDVLGNSTALTAVGFDIALVTAPKKGLFKKAEEKVCLLVKFVPLVDAQAVSDAWAPALRVKAPGADLCTVLLIGPGMAPAKELAAAVSDQRRKSRGQGPVLVPVDVRDWDALFPPDTPAAVRSLVQRLKDEKR